MKKIFIINHKIHNCGVYQYAKRVYNILKKSKSFVYEYYEIDNLNEYSIMLNGKPDIIIYNHIQLTMPWLTENMIHSNRNNNIKQGTFVHNSGHFNCFDFYLSQNPNDAEGLLRPLLEYDNPQEKINHKLNIGTFGFGFTHKKYNEMFHRVYEEFKDDDIVFNIHFTLSHYGNNMDTLIDIDNSISIFKNTGIKAIVTNEFKNDNDMLDFLYKNDLNIFFYENYNYYNGISSVIDYAISVKKPIAINESNMFQHINNNSNIVIGPSNPIKQILNYGNDYIIQLNSRWNNENFIHTFEKLINKYAI